MPRTINLSKPRTLTLEELDIIGLLFETYPDKKSFSEGYYQLQFQGSPLEISLKDGTAIRVSRRDPQKGDRCYFCTKDTIGEGGVGTAHEAVKLKFFKDCHSKQSTISPRLYAVKKSNSSSLEDEAEFAAKLDYMHAKPLMVDEKTYYLVMEKFNVKPIMTLEEHLDFSLSFLQCLKNLHEHGIIHCDLQTGNRLHMGNILFDGKRVCLIDFNNSRELYVDDESGGINIYLMQRDLYDWKRSVEGITKQFNGKDRADVVQTFEEFFIRPHIARLMTDDTQKMWRQKKFKESFSNFGKKEEYYQLFNQAVNDFSGLIQDLKTEHQQRILSERIAEDNNLGRLYIANS
ncbi:hypothetical protein B0B39_18285 (plasmid) [Legionella longbeachae]|uniref:hypothetical protein n=1 Tax=Legionella longbeachae TaxID=450 RepID=UPI000CF6D591|nr:hypothetical protein [Legionella longbeachae]ARM35488.2 hypothetical protein B0B39_18285 [Legionella longbeachae]